MTYIKAIDVWMDMTLLFVFAAYMELAFVIVLSRTYTKRMEARELRNHVQSESVSIDSCARLTAITCSAVVN